MSPFICAFDKVNKRKRCPAPLRRCSGWTRRRRLTLRKWTKPPKIPADSLSICADDTNALRLKAKHLSNIYFLLATWDDNAGWLRSWNSPETYAGFWDWGAVRKCLTFQKLSELELGRDPERNDETRPRNVHPPLVLVNCRFLWCRFVCVWTVKFNLCSWSNNESSPLASYTLTCTTSKFAQSVP